MTDPQALLLHLGVAGTLIGLAWWMVWRDKEWRARQRNRTLMKMAVKRAGERERLMKFNADEPTFGEVGWAMYRAEKARMAENVEK